MKKEDFSFFGGFWGLRGVGFALNANYPLITYNYRSETSENIFIEFSLQKYINLYKINLLGLEVFELKNNLFFRRLQNQAGVSKSVFWTIHGGF